MGPSTCLRIIAGPYQPRSRYSESVSSYLALLHMYSLPPPPLGVLDPTRAVRLPLIIPQPDLNRPNHVLSPTIQQHWLHIVSNSII